MTARQPATSRRAYVRFTIAFCLLTAAFAVTRDGRFRLEEQLARPLTSIPAGIDGWQMTGEEALSSDILEKLRPTSYLLRSYSRDGSQLGLFVVFYAAQHNGDSMHSPKHCLPGAGWEISRKDLLTLPGDQGKFVVNNFAIANAGQRLNVLYWYQFRHRITANEYAGKLLLIRDALFEGRTGGAMVRITVPDQPGALDKAAVFGSQVLHEVDRCLGGGL